MSVNSERIRALLYRLYPADQAEPAYQEITVSAINRRGKPITCRVTCTPMADGDQPDGVILLMDDDALPARDGIEADASESTDHDGRPAFGARVPRPVGDANARPLTG